jgi:anaerobic ribonucleoside-triphosphate reductase activating protein
MLENNLNTYTNKLNIASYVTQTKALGPGIRAVVWTQGCPLNCAGCIAPAWIPFIEANQFTPEELLSKLNIQQIDGLTLSGGEPMEQAAGLAELAKLARQIKDINLICFTGYRYERLVNQPPNPGVQSLLREVDVLIDGPYIQSKNDSVGLRGSSNQRIFYLNTRLQESNLENQKRKVEVTVRNGELSFVGIPTPQMKTAMDQVIDSYSERI